MVAQDNHQIVRNFYDAFNSRDYHRAAGVFSNDCTFKLIGFNTTYRGASEIRPMLEGWVRAFPDLKLEISNLISSGEWVIVEIKGRGTHRGTLSTPDGDLSPTGQHVEMHSCDVIQCQNGKISSVHCYLETGELLKQLGQKVFKGAA